MKKKWKKEYTPKNFLGQKDEAGLTLLTGLT